MVRAVSITAEVPPNREVHITLPDDVPVGPADIVVVIASHTASKLNTLGDLLRSEFFGMWKDRADITDSVEFARRLRIEAWGRAA